MPSKPASTPNEIAAQLGVGGDESYILQTAHVRILLAAASGTVDLNALARRELAVRGIGQDGKWVGFDSAAEQWGIGN